VYYSKKMLKMVTTYLDIVEIEKKRNRMKTDLLESILYYKFGLRRLNTRVQDFKPPNSL